MLSIMKSDNWVCEDALEEDEWVCPLTISLKEEDEVLADLEFEIRHSLFGTMGFLCFTAPSRLNVKLDDENTRIAKYHDVTNLAIEAAIKALNGGRDTPRTRLLWSIAKVRDLMSDEGLGFGHGDDRMRTGRITCASPLVLLCAEDVSVRNDVYWNLRRQYRVLTQSQCTACPCRPRCPPKGGNLPLRSAKRTRI